MTCMTVTNAMDRQLLAVLLDPIKRELAVSDAAMGLLTGTSFAMLHVVATIPIAVWADRGVRRSIIALGLAVWSGLTFLTAFARTYAEVFALRVGIGIGEATGAGPAQSLIADLFPPSRRATALALLIVGGPIGSMLALAGGGYLAEAWGWRTAFVVLGAPGLLLALLIRLTVDEPVRGGLDASRAGPAHSSEHAASALGPGFRRDLASLVRIPSLRHLVIASGLNSTGLYAIQYWAVPFMTRIHGLTTGEAGVKIAIASGLFTALGTFAGGPLADRLARREVRSLAWLPALTSALVVPFAVGFAFAPRGSAAIWLLAPAAFFAGTYFGPVFGAVQTLSAPGTRALAGALLTTANTVLGLGVGPLLVGWLNDLGGATLGDEAIRRSLAAAAFFHLGAALFLLRAGVTLRGDLSERGRREE